MRLNFDPGTRAAGNALIGGAPLRVMRLSDAGARLVERWRDGAEVTAGKRLAVGTQGGGKPCGVTRGRRRGRPA